MFSLGHHNKIIHKLKRLLHTTNLTKGYIVLVPEIGEDAEAAGNILKPDGLPAFNGITIENCMGAISHQAVTVDRAVKEIENDILKNNCNVDISKIFRHLDEVTGPLESTWGTAKTLYLGNCTLIPTKSYMNIHERARNARAAKYMSKPLYDAIAKQSTPQNTENFTAGEQRLIKKYLLEGKLNGLMLPPKKIDHLKEVLTKLNKERAIFKNNVNAAMNSFAHVLYDQKMVREFPPYLLEATAKDPANAAAGPWQITLQPQIVDGFLKYSHSRTHRWNVWQANMCKASMLMDKKFENSTHIEEIRALRREQAKILGYPSFAVMSMETKMVGSIEALRRVFQDLLQQARPRQEVEVGELQKFANDNGFQTKLDLYDIPYWQRKYLENSHNVDEELIREYFPLHRVMANLFSFSERLFNIKIVERADTDVWQPAVQYFDVYDCDRESSDSAPIGGFFVDCYSKENKYGKNNSWMVNISNRNQAIDKKPVCAMIFNFTPPEHGKAYLLSIEDLRMVFRTFGFALQHLLTQAEFSELAGLSNIEWDASQVCGEVMSNFLNCEETLVDMSHHYVTNERIPENLVSNIKHLRNDLAGYNLCRELYLADLDLEVHHTKEFWLDIVKRLWPVYHCIPLNKRDAHLCSMTEIFSGDWAAAYYSGVYSKIIAANVTELFAKTSDATDVGKRFKNTFLASGGSVAAADVFQKFVGKDVSIDVYLKSLEISQDSQENK